MEKQVTKKPLDDIREFAVSKIPNKQGQELLRIINEVEKNVMPCPLDANGEPIHVGDKIVSIFLPEKINQVTSIEYNDYSLNGIKISLLYDKDENALTSHPEYFIHNTDDASLIMYFTDQLQNKFDTENRLDRNALYALRSIAHKLNQEKKDNE